MILYQLCCEDDHTFEAWFRNSEAYEIQAVSGHVECPYCGSITVFKAPVVPHVASAIPPQNSANPKDDDQLAEQVAQQILDAVGKIRDFAEENFENVGEGFADEARKIHQGESQERGIYGRASKKEAESLEDEGIEIVRLPNVSRSTD